MTKEKEGRNMSQLLRVIGLLLSLAVLLLPLSVLAQQKTIVLKKADVQPLNNSRARLSKAWAEEVEKRTQGRVKIEYFPAQSLLKAREMFEGVRTGVADIGIWVQAYTPSVSPISALWTLPGISPQFRPAIRAANELIMKGDFAYFREELRKLGVEPLYAWGVSDQEMISTKPIAGLAALKGLKTRVIGREWPQLISEFDGTPVAMPWAEVYEALSRGTIDANVGFVTANRASKLYEVAKHHTQIKLGAPAGPLAIINKRTWDGLPKDVQQAMREASQAYADQLADIYEKEYQDDVNEMKANGVRFYEWSSGDRAKLQVAMESLWESWAKKMDDKGVPGREALRRYIELQKKYSR